MGGTIEACCLQPIDVIKTRLQLDKAGKYKGGSTCPKGAHCTGREAAAECSNWLDPVQVSAAGVVGRGLLVHVTWPGCIHACCWMPAMNAQLQAALQAHADHKASHNNTEHAICDAFSTPAAATAQHL